MAKGVEYFIAKRTSQLEKRGGGGVMMGVARIAVALAIAVMIITLAVISGFRQEIESKLTSMSGQLLVTSVGSGSNTTAHPIVRDKYVELVMRCASSDVGVKLERIMPFISRGVILRTTEGVEGVVLKGVGEEIDRASYEAGLFEGVVPQFGSSDSGRSALISKMLAEEMKLKIGDKLELLTTDSREAEWGEANGSLARRMRRDLYKVAGIYSLNLGEGEKRVILTDIRNVRRLNNFAQNEISGYDIWCNSIDKAPAVAESINELLLTAPDNSGEGMAAYAAQSLYPSIFDWLAAHNINAAVVIGIMMVVAIFNIVTAMLILVLERTRLIGLLKVLGMRSDAIRRIFLIRAVSIASWGMLWGNGVAIVLCLVQQYFEVLKLDEKGYLLSVVPISLDIWWLLLLNVAVVVVVSLIVIVPTRIISSIEPSEAIKFE